MPPRMALRHSELLKQAKGVHGLRGRVDGASKEDNLGDDRPHVATSTNHA